MKKTGKILMGTALILGSVGAFGMKNPSSIYANADVLTEFVSRMSDTSEKNQKSALQTRAKAAYLMDFSGNTVMYSYKEQERLPIASMCKIMTLLLSFDAIKEGNLTFDEEICVSERAASMGGSQVFLEANAKYSVKELIKSIVVCSANDSCVAMAERISGSESLFVDKMNEKAVEIGANNTLFSNCTGLPREPQYSCAKDVAIMLKNLLNHEEYFEFGKVWMDKFSHPEGRYTEITNTNKLVRFYDGCDGGKTGFTNEAGFCLAATAKRNDTRVISVVIGEENSANRFEDVKTMFDYAFANYKNTVLAEAGMELTETASVNGGKEKILPISPARNVCVLEKRGEKAHITTKLYFHSVKAPVQKGDEVGEMLVFKDGIEIDRVPLLAAESVERAGFFDYLRNVAKAWNARG